MPYQERGSGRPHFDGKNYQMWSKRMAAFLRGKGQIFWDVMVDTGYVQPMNFLAPGSKDMFYANNKAVDYLNSQILAAQKVVLGYEPFFLLLPSSELRALLSALGPLC
jgi:hypothetical protein